jgi:hypothetical protein
VTQVGVAVEADGDRPVGSEALPQCCEQYAFRVVLVARDRRAVEHEVGAVDRVVARLEDMSDDRVERLSIKWPARSGPRGQRGHDLDPHTLELAPRRAKLALRAQRRWRDVVADRPHLIGEVRECRDPAGERVRLHGEGANENPPPA